MPATIHEQQREAGNAAPLAPVDYHAAEGFVPQPDRTKIWREWMMVGLGLAALVAVLGMIVAVAALVIRDDNSGAAPAATPAPSTAAAVPAADRPAPPLAQ